MRLFMSLAGLSLASSAFALQLPNRTLKNETFRPAAQSLAGQEDFKGQETQFRELAIGVREHPDTINKVAQDMVADENPADRAALEAYVKSELKREALARQYVLLIDRSGSMTAPDQDGGHRRNRWGAAEKACEGLIDAMFANDMDHKVPTYLFGHDVEAIGELTNKKQVLDLFSQHGPTGYSTNLSAALELALEDHVGTKRNNYEVVPGTTIVVITDGAPNSEENVISVLKKYANVNNGYIKNDQELAISFIQIGDDPAASRFLEAMDAGWNFAGNQMDICDTKKDDDLRRLGPATILEHAIFD